MPGHYGNRTVTVKNLKIVKILPEKRLILVKGAVPGPSGSLVVIRKANPRQGKEVNA
jgi:large subunit ribosomal protein L3